jgi:hypothetical protein
MSIMAGLLLPLPLPLPLPLLFSFVSRRLRSEHEGLAAAGLAGVDSLRR